MRAFVLYLGIIGWAILSGFCTGSGSQSNLQSAIELVGSTPGDAYMKSQLAIPASTYVDFIRWKLILNNNRFTLDINFGEGQPNTLGFKNGGERKHFEGTFSVSEANGAHIYDFQDVDKKTAIRLVQLTENVFHFLSDEKQLLVGNGGWSYILNRKESTNLSQLTLLSDRQVNLFASDSTNQVIFDGRTPCQSLAKNYNLTVTERCFKLKWRLVLNRDPKTKMPSSYKIQRIERSQKELVGVWRIIRGTPSNSSATVYSLQGRENEKPILLLAVDSNVLLFLDENQNPYIGNADFSYALNKKP